MTCQLCQHPMERTEGGWVCFNQQHQAPGPDDPVVGMIAIAVRQSGHIDMTSTMTAEQVVPPLKRALVIAKIARERFGKAGVAKWN